jgi:Kazal-type serine protease inhibitor domain
MTRFATAFAIVLLAACSGHAEQKMCPRVAHPVCGLTKDAKRSTFTNDCMAEGAGARVLHQGACEGGDMCSMLYKPVCASDPATGREKTYSSQCASEHANAAVTHDGECKAP